MAESQDSQATQQLLVHESTAEHRPSRPLVIDAMSVFFAWEKLRLVYNGVLIAQVLIYVVFVGKGWALNFWAMVIIGVFVVNVCFCVGPIIESYLCWAGYERRSIRWWIFTGGTVLTLMASWSAMESIVPHVFSVPDR